MADGMQWLPDGIAKLAKSHSASAQIAQHRSQLHGFHQCNFFKKTFSSSVRKCLSTTAWAGKTSSIDSCRACPVIRRRW
jgi:hypothetical protein